MNATIQEWIDKADEDFRVMERESRVRKNPSFNAICFHAQQCIEKLMKAALILKKVLPPRIHDLVGLNELLSQNGIVLKVSRDLLRELSLGSVLFRYPGDNADKETAKTAKKICRLLRKTLLDWFTCQP